MLAKALARSIGGTVRRIQFTPDLLPTDVTGVSVFNQNDQRVRVPPRWAVFANIVVGDEINRASPKTQSALLECMEERQVTVDGDDLPARDAVHGHRDPEPDRDARAPTALPEAQRDRFMLRLSIGYPVEAPRSRCWTRTPAPTRSTTSSRSPTAADVREAGRSRPRGIRLVRRPALRRRPGRPPPVAPPSCGSVPRRGRPCTWCARQGRAPRLGRDYVVPDDVQGPRPRCCHTASFPPSRRR